MISTLHPPGPHAVRRPASSPPGAAVELTDVHRRYGPVTAVDGVSLTVPAGQIVAVLGPNGAGKSTVNEMILGLVAPDRGQVRVLGGDPHTALRSGRVGAMLQGGALLAEATARDMLRLMHGLYALPLPLGEVIERADCAEFLSTRTDRLSGGQAQRLRYALALLPDPDLLILDEPTVAMDVDARRRFWRSMRDVIATGRTVLFATHYLEEADETADRVVLLARGRVVADGTSAQIKASVGGRTISFRMPAAPGLSAGADPDLSGLYRLPGVRRVSAVGSRVHLRTSTSDDCLRVLLATRPDAYDIEVSSPRLEEAFIQLTHDPTGDPA